MKQKLIAAETMARAVQFDPQFALPHCPHFPAEFVTIPIADGLLIDGGDELQVFRGRATKVLLPRLLPLLDGTRTLQQIAENLPDISFQAIYNALSLLYTRGLLEDSAADPITNGENVNPQTLAFFRRYVDNTRVNRSALQAQARLQQTEVIVFTFGPNAQETSVLLTSLLRETGVSHVEAVSCKLSYTELSEFMRAGQQNKLIVAFVEGEDDRAFLGGLDDICAEVGIPWLRAAFYDDQHLELGPYFERGETACYRCFTRAIQAKRDTTPINITDVSTKLLSRIALNLLAVETIYLLSRIASPATGLAVMRYDLANWQTQRLHFPKLPGCIRCRSLQAPGENAEIDEYMGWIDTALVYEDAVAFPSRHLLDPKAHQVHYRSDNLELAHEGKRYFSAKHIALPDQQDLYQLPGETLECLSRNTQEKRPLEGLTQNRLATLLLLSAGIRINNSESSSKLQRWSATGGNLGSVELYVVVLRINGLDPGFYFYQPIEHCLASIQYLHAIEDTYSFVQSATPNAVNADALIITTAAYRRVSHKYGAFGYRICNLDAGFALGQIHVAGRSLGLQTQVVPDWADDVIAKQFNLKDLEEMVTAVVAISGS